MNIDTTFAPDNRRVFMIQAVAGAAALCASLPAAAQTMLAETDAQATALVTKPMPPRLTKPSKPNMPPDNSAATAPCIRLPPAQRRAVVRCSQANKSQAKVGVAPGLKRPEAA